MRIIGIDDGSFHPHRKEKQETLLVAVLFQNLRILAVRVGRIEVDGREANQVLSSILRKMRFDLVMLSGISFGGFNVVDIAELSRVIHKPVSAVTGERPDNHAVRQALRHHFVDWKERWQMVRNAGKIYSYKPLANEPPLFFEVQGGSPVFVKKAVALTSRISRLPEPIRVARIVARALSNLTIQA